LIAQVYLSTQIANVFRDPQSPVITLLAGLKAVPLTAHKDLTCNVSPVFKAAFNSEFLEGASQRYNLEDSSEDAVRLLIKWFYSHELDLKQTQQRRKCLNPSIKTRAHFITFIKPKEDMLLCELWVRHIV